jgi:hypothetical protein
LTGEDGGGAAAAAGWLAAGWLAAAAVTAGSAYGWVSSQADFIVSRRLLAVREYCVAVRVSWYRYGSTRIGFLLPVQLLLPVPVQLYSRTAVREIVLRDFPTELMNSHYRLTYLARYYSCTW